MKKLLLGSFSLLLFSLSIIIFQISCKKTAEAQTQTSTNCSETATVVITVNFRPGFVPSSTRTQDNNVSIGNQSLTPEPNYVRLYFYDFRDVGTTAKRVYTFKNIIPGVYQYDAAAYNSANVYIFTPTTTATFSGGQTYNITLTLP